MRALLARYLVACLVLGVSAATRAGDLTPIREVVAFRVLPVGGNRLERIAQHLPANSPEVRASSEGEAAGHMREAYTRVQFGENWLDLIARAKHFLAAGWINPKALSGATGGFPQLVPGKYVRMAAQPDRAFIELDYVVRNDESYSIRVYPESIELRPQIADAELVDKMRSDPTKASLFTATDAIGLSDHIVLQLVEIFADQIDFYRELHRGYRCALVYEPVFHEGHIERTGRILAAQFDLPDRTVEAYFFDDGAGHSGYFSADGTSLKKVFRQLPVQFSRISSEFAALRLHPILGVWRAHRGTDYAAPSGTPVTATADGLVAKMGPNGGLGNLLVLEHSGGVSTYYGHLQRFAEHLGVGDSVRKGEVVGYVGMTGLTTGPHLHYEFRVPDGNGESKSIPPPEAPEPIRISSPKYPATLAAYRSQLLLARQLQLTIE
jgi:murein DD-endopeptidase MepM/ murein hydrolase activator NlpD